MARRKSKFLNYLMITFLIIEVFTVADFYFRVYPIFPICSPGIEDTTNMHGLLYFFSAIASFLLASYLERKQVIFINIIIFLCVLWMYLGLFCA